MNLERLIEERKEMAIPMAKIVLMVLDIKVPEKILLKKINRIDKRMWKLSGNSEFQELLADFYIGLGKTCLSTGGFLKGIAAENVDDDEEEDEEENEEEDA